MRNFRAAAVEINGIREGSTWFEVALDSIPEAFTGQNACVAANAGDFLPQ